MDYNVSGYISECFGYDYANTMIKEMKEKHEQFNQYMLNRTKELEDNAKNGISYDSIYNNQFYNYKYNNQFYNYKPKAKMTFIIYAITEYQGSYSSSLSDMLYDELKEIKSTLNDKPDDFNIIVYEDNRKTPILYHLNKENGLEPIIKYEEELKSNDKDVMLSIMKNIIKLYPAEKYAYMFYGVSAGWCMQNINPVWRHSFIIPLNDFRYVLSNLPKSEFIINDMEAMQNIEVAYEFKDYTKYLIGTPATVDIYKGSPYDKIMKYIYNNDLKEAVTKIYENNSSNCVISLVDTKYLKEFANEFSKISHSLINSVINNGLDDLQKYFSYSKNEQTDVYDIKHVLYKHLDTESYDNIVSYLDKIVVCNYASDTFGYGTRIHPGGNHSIIDRDHIISFGMFLPDKKYENDNVNWNEHFKITSWYKDAGFENTEFYK